MAILILKHLKYTIKWLYTFVILSIDVKNCSMLKRDNSFCFDELSSGRLASRAASRRRVRDSRGGKFLEADVYPGLQAPRKITVHWIDYCV